MRASKIFSFLFGILGTALMILTVMLSLSSLEGKTTMGEVPVEAELCTEKLMLALSEGDYLQAEALLYGESRLGDPREASSKVGKKVWMAFADSFAYEFTSGCYGSGNGLSRDVIITTLDLSTLPGHLLERADDLLTLREQDAQEGGNTDMLYEDGVILDSVVDEIVETAVMEALQQDIKTHTTKLTLDLVNEDGGWQVVPSAELLKAVSGGL